MMHLTQSRPRPYADGVDHDADGARFTARRAEFTRCVQCRAERDFRNQPAYRGRGLDVAFGDAYSDAEIAAVANYVTARLGKGSNITAQDVTDLRKQTSQQGSMMELSLQPQLVDQLRVKSPALTKAVAVECWHPVGDGDELRSHDTMQIETGISALLLFSSAYMKRMPATILYLALSWATDRSVDSGK